MAGVSLADARRVIAAAEKKALEIGQPMNIAVADEGGNLVSHVRMDGAWMGSIDISINKAWTSRAFDIETGRELWKKSLPAPGAATPMTYRAGKDQRQYLVIAAGGHGGLGTRHGDYVVAFALPDAAR